MGFANAAWTALFLAAGMAWHVGWSLVLGFTLSGLVRAVVSDDRMRSQLGRNGLIEVARASAYGAVSSSCSYAAAALSRTLFTKGAGFIPSIAFLFASTNLVIELGLLLYLLLGWQFTAAEWIGGLVLIAVLSGMVALTYPRGLIEAARARAAAAFGGAVGDESVPGATLWGKLRDPRTRILIAQHAAMDWSMLRGDLIAGFLIAGALAAFVPDGVWHRLFVTGGPALVTVPLNACAGAVIAIFTFVCSIGNVPMAAVLWAGGISFGGVLAFLYADLIVLPLLDVYRKYYGTRMALYLFATFFLAIVISASLVDFAFAALHATPLPNPHLRATIEQFGFDYTFWLNIAALTLAGYLAYLNKTHPAEHACAMHDTAPDPCAQHAESAEPCSAGNTLAETSETVNAGRGRSDPGS